MELQLQIVFIISSVFTLLFVLNQIRKHKMSIDDSIIWIIWGLFIMILSVFPNLAIWISNKLGFVSPSNFIFSLFTFFLYILLFGQTIKISSLKEQNKELVQKLSLKEYEEMKSKKDANKS